MAHLEGISFFQFQRTALMEYIHIEKHTGEEGRLLVRLDHKEFSLDVARMESNDLISPLGLT